MRCLRLLFTLLFLCVLAHAQEWTLYYSQTEVLNGDGSITVTPTVSIVGDDGGYCSAFDGNFGVETPALMLNGNYWQFGDSIQSGQVIIGGQTINFAYTFPNVTLPSDGTQVDMSYATKVHGVCYGNHNGSYPPFQLSPFYDYYFLEGAYPMTYPSPCFIIDHSPTCALPWPALWVSVPRYGVQRDLDSQAVGLKGMKVILLSSDCTRNPVTGFANVLTGGWGKSDFSCVQTDQFPVPSSFNPTCTIDSLGRHCYSYTAEGYNYLNCPGLARTVPTTCVGWLDVFPVEESRTRIQ